MTEPVPQAKPEEVPKEALTATKKPAEEPKTSPKIDVERLFTPENGGDKFIEFLSEEPPLDESDPGKYAQKLKEKSEIFLLREKANSSIEKIFIDEIEESYGIKLGHESSPGLHKEISEHLLAMAHENPENYRVLASYSIEHTELQDEIKTAEKEAQLLLEKHGISREQGEPAPEPEIIMGSKSEDPLRGYEKSLAKKGREMLGGQLSEIGWWLIGGERPGYAWQRRSEFKRETTEAFSKLKSVSEKKGELETAQAAVINIIRMKSPELRDKIARQVSRKIETGLQDFKIEDLPRIKKELDSLSSGRNPFGIKMSDTERNIHEESLMNKVAKALYEIVGKEKSAVAMKERLGKTLEAILANTYPGNKDLQTRLDAFLDIQISRSEGEIIEANKAGDAASRLEWQGKLMMLRQLKEKAPKMPEAKSSS